MEKAIEQKGTEGTKEFEELVREATSDLSYIYLLVFGDLNLLPPAGQRMDLIAKVTELRDAKQQGKHLGSNLGTTITLLLCVLRTMAAKKQTREFSHTKFVGDELALVCTLLVEKNASYGNTALEPCGIFARGSALDLIDVRIDDKLSRLLNAPEAFGEDVLLDLAGYLVLRLIVLRRDGDKAGAEGAAS